MRDRMLRVVRLVILPALLLAAILTLIFLPGLASSNTLEVSFIDVGQGDAALLRDGNGFDVLIDGGKTSAGPTVVAYLREQGIDDIDVMVASHTHADHIGGLIDVLEMNDIPVLSVLYNGYPGTTATWNSFATAVADEGLSLAPAQFPDSYTWGLMTVYVLHPDPGLSDPDQNDASVVLLVSHDDVDFLFTGDIGSAIEATVVARGTPVVAEVLKVGHHGSKFSSSSSFLSAVGPDEAIILVGNNPYGHPTIETMDRLLAAGARIYRTDQNGTVLVQSNGITYEVISTFLASQIFLPIIAKDPTSTPPPTPTSTPEPPTPTSTPESLPNVQITYIFYDGVVPRVESDEYAEITNLGAGSANLLGWRLNAGDLGQDFYFPSFLLSPGQSCRVYTNEIHPEYCGFSYGSGSALWNNGGDCGYLYDGGGGAPVSEYCY